MSIADRINELWRASRYDCRPAIPEWARKQWGFMRSDKFASDYGRFKWAVVKAIKPRVILELGVGPAVAALAFLNAAPEALYLGVDSLYDQKSLGYDYEGLWKEKGLKVLKTPSTEMPAGILKGVDLLHIDAQHDRQATHDDVELALRASVPWILVDDCKDREVLLGALEAVREVSGDACERYLFEKSYNGDLLLHLDVAERPRSSSAAGGVGKG